MAVASDTSTFIAYIQGTSGPDVDKLISALRTNELMLPPVVVTELLSQPHLPAQLRATILNLVMLDVRTADFWIRAAAMRSTVLAHKFRARLAYALIAQSCIDHDVPLITRDGDFRHFEKHCGLKLA